MKKLLTKSLLATVLLVMLVPMVSAKELKENPLLNDSEKLNAIATAFGISVETLTSELESGQTIKEIAIEYNVPKETADQYVKKHHARLTIEQMDQIAAQLNISTDELKEAIKNHLLKGLFEAHGTDMKTYMQSIGVAPFKHLKN